MQKLCTLLYKVSSLNTCMLHILRDRFSFIGLLSLRLYLVPILLAAGFTKLAAFDSTAAWFGNANWGLRLPFPKTLTALAIFAEIGGGFALLFGFLTRYFALPLMVVMAVATFSVHWENGWFAIAPSSPSSSMAKPLAAVNFPGAVESLENSAEVSKRLRTAKGLLREHGNYSWLSDRGNFVILNNGVEFAVTYFLMLLILFFYGGGKYVSVDYWLHRYAQKHIAKKAL